MAVKDWFRLVGALYRAAYLSATKSVANLWLSSFMQIFFYVAQFLFWAGVSDHQSMMSSQHLFGFFVTMAIVDNLYLVVLGPGSILAQQLILGRRLEQVLLLPRNPLALLMVARPNLSFLPCFVLSLGAFAFYLVQMRPSLSATFSFVIAATLGVIVLNFISFIYRLSSFWTAAIVQIRNSNPSFKIMVRPLDAFGGPLKLILMTLFPALFITGVPAQILTGQLGLSWLFGAIAAALWLGMILIWLWKYGLRRYGVTAL